jgi:hypothetical protein
VSARTTIYWGMGKSPSIYGLLLMDCENSPLRFFLFSEIGKFENEFRISA